MPSIDERFFEKVGWRRFIRRHPGHPAVWFAFDLLIAAVVFAFVRSALRVATSWSAVTVTSVAIVAGAVVLALGGIDARRRRTGRHGG